MSQKILDARCYVCYKNILKQEEIVEIELATALDAHKNQITCLMNVHSLVAHSKCFRRMFPKLFLSLKLTPEKHI